MPWQVPNDPPQTAAPVRSSGGDRAPKQRVPMGSLRRRRECGVKWMLIVASGVFAAIVALKAFEPVTPERVKIGFLVKMPEQAWFINENAAARTVGRQMDVDVVTIGTPDG